MPGTETETTTVTRWVREKPFNPLSPPQVMKYLRHMGYKIPLSRKERKPTTNKEALERLSRQHPEDEVLKEILKVRSIRKGRGYLKDKYLWRDGRLHTLYTFIPETGRLSSQRPNLQNQPQARGDEWKVMVANAIRGAMIATPGFELLEFDWKGIEALLVGFFAEDADYIRAAKLGVHGIFASHVLAQKGLWKEPIDLSHEDEEILGLIEKLKSDHLDVYDISKRKIHAGSYGQRIYNQAKDMGVTVKEAKELDRFFNQMAPKVKAWQGKTLRRAHEEGVLMNPFGYVRYFSDVFEWDPGKQEWGLGREANKALAFMPQSTAAAMMREALIYLDDHAEDAWDGKARLLVTTHDSVLTESRPEFSPWVISDVKAIMERSWKELNDLVVEVEMKRGLNWGEMS